MIVMDNAQTNRNRKTIDFLKAEGVKAKTICPYTPELNPTEKFIRVNKAKLRRELLECGKIHPVT